MKFETFELLLNNCLNLYNTACERDEAFSKLFGGDTILHTEWWEFFILDTIKAIELELGDTKSTVTWLFWDSMNNKDGYLDYISGETVYEGNLEIIWMDLTGILDPSLGKGQYKKPLPKEDDISEIFIGEEVSTKEEQSTKSKNIQIDTKIINNFTGKNFAIKSVFKHELSDFKNIKEFFKEEIMNPNISAEEFTIILRDKRMEYGRDKTRVYNNLEKNVKKIVSKFKPRLLSKITIVNYTAKLSTYMSSFNSVSLLDSKVGAKGNNIIIGLSFYDRNEIYIINFSKKGVIIERG